MSFEIDEVIDENYYLKRIRKCKASGNKLPIASIYAEFCDYLIMEAYGQIRDDINPEWRQHILADEMPQLAQELLDIKHKFQADGNDPIVSFICNISSTTHLADYVNKAMESVQDASLKPRNCALVKQNVTREASALNKALLSTAHFIL